MLKNKRFISRQGAKTAKEFEENILWNVSIVVTT
jgi:hypothetical protein